MARDKRIEPLPFYKNSLPHWQFLLNSYESGQAYLAGNYLFQHERETDTSFTDRRRRAVPPGYLRGVVKTYHSLLSRARVQRTTKDEQFGKFVNEDCDKKGNGLSEFVLNTVFPASQCIGWAWVLVDMPQPKTRPESKADEVAAGIEPYCIAYQIDEIISWAFDDVGALNHVTVQLPPGTYGRKNAVRVWDRDLWIDFASGEPVGGGEHMLGRVPFAICYNERSTLNPNLGLSAVQNIAYMNREVYNLYSLLQEFYYRQCYNMLAGPAGAVTDKDGKKIVGTQNMIPLEQGDLMPGYVSPPVDPAQFLIDTLKEVVSGIFHEAGLVDRSAEQVAQAQSGISRAFQFHTTNSLLSSKARNLEQFEMDIADLYYLWTDKGESDYVVSYPDNFDVRDTTQLVEEAKAVAELPVMSDTLKREYLKRVVAQLVPNVDEDTLKKITAEIESQVFGSSEPKTPQGQPGSLEARLARAF